MPDTEPSFLAGERLLDNKQAAGVFGFLVGDFISFEEHPGLICRGGLKVRRRAIDGCWMAGCRRAEFF
jgi:hypothetical protein